MCLLRGVGARESGGIERSSVLRGGVGERTPAVAGITGGVVRHGDIMPRVRAFGKAEASLPRVLSFARISPVGTDISQKRMTETWTGRAACLLLALVWFVSMGVADANAYSYVPLLVGLAVVILLALSAMIRGAKTVSLSKTAWLSLGVGCYFLIRCLCSPSMVESWQEASIILGCGVFYVAGVYAAQGRSLRIVFALLVIAGLLNLLYFGLMQYTDVPMGWAGRPAVGPGSINNRPVTLFVYKNHASAFLSMVAMLLFAAALWGKSGGWRSFGMCLLAMVCLYVAMLCHSRSPYFMTPLMAAAGWVIWVVIKLYEDDRMGVGVILSGFVLLSLLGVAVCSVLFEPDVIRFFESLDSHGRYIIWRETCLLLPETPLWGYGALSSRWVMMTQIDHHVEFGGVANFAHNEYLQAWVDYGLIGLGCMLFVVGWHVCRSLRVMASEQVSSQQRIVAALAVLCLVGWGCCSMVDFFWHHFAIAGMTAFSAGIAASPYPYVDVQRGDRRVVAAQTFRGKGGMALVGVMGTCTCFWLVARLLPVWSVQWEFNRLSQPGADENGEHRHAILAHLVPLYPATELMDQYFRIPRHGDCWQQEAELLRMTLAANPRQLFTATMLAELLSRHGEYEEAESVYRRYFPGDGPDVTFQGDWACMYALNLLRRGQYLWATGEQAKGYSLMIYALRITKTQPYTWRADHPHRKDVHVWSVNGKYMPEWHQYLKARRQDVAIMRMLKVEPDDSWQAPDASGKPALYRRYGAPESLEKADSAASVPAAAQKE